MTNLILLDKGMFGKFLTRCQFKDPRLSSRFKSPFFLLCLRYSDNERPHSHWPEPFGMIMYPRWAMYFI